MGVTMICSTTVLYCTVLVLLREKGRERKKEREKERVIYLTPATGDQDDQSPQFRIHFPSVDGTFGH